MCVCVCVCVRARARACVCVCEPTNQQTNPINLGPTSHLRPAFSTTTSPSTLPPSNPGLHPPPPPHPLPSLPAILDSTHLHHLTLYPPSQQSWTPPTSTTSPSTLPPSNPGLHPPPPPHPLPSLPAILDSTHLQLPDSKGPSSLSKEEC